MAARRYLIVGPAWVGDMVMAQSLFISLRQQHPGCSIDVLAPAWSLPLLARMPEVRKGIELPLSHGEFGLSSRWRLGRGLRSEHYDQAIVLPRSLKAALIPFFADAVQRTGFRGEMRYGLLNDIRPLDKQRLRQTVQRYVALGQPGKTALPPVTIPEPKLSIDQLNQMKQRERLKLAQERPAIALLPGAEYGPAKQWPLEHWHELAKGLLATGYQVWVIGSAKDRASGETICATQQGPIHNLCGQTELIDAIDLIAACDAAVTNDSGLMHIAAAVGTPLVAIYGSSTPEYTPPLTACAAICYRALKCSPCFKRVCPLGHSDCLHGIDAEAVQATLADLLACKEA